MKAKLKISTKVEIEKYFYRQLNANESDGTVESSMDENLWKPLWSITWMNRGSKITKNMNDKTESPSPSGPPANEALHQCTSQHSGFGPRS